MPLILVDMSSDGRKIVEVSDSELEILNKLDNEYGTIHDAMNKLPEEQSGYKKLCEIIMKRRKATTVRSFIFYT